jgi:hypothetical protein
LVIVAGIHANEPAGIQAARRVLARLDAAPPRSFTGRFVAVAGNVRALEAARAADNVHRYIDSDLNRMFTHQRITRAQERIAAGNAAAEDHETIELIAELTALVASYPGAMAVLDLHTTSAPSPGFLAFEDSLVARRFCAQFPLARVLGFEEELPGLLIDWVTNELGRVACVIESGQHDDPAAVDGHEAAIWMGLDALGVLSIDAPDHPADEDPRAVLARAAGDRASRIYDVRRVIPVPSAAFTIRPTIDSFGRLRARRTLVATEAAGDEVIEHRAAESGLMFMPNRQRDRRAGDDAYFVVREVGPVWLRISAWLRASTWVHRWLVPAMPGVRVDPADPHAVLVEPRVAVVLRRQIFHLLGYRLVEHGAEHTMSGTRRMASGFTLVVRGVLSVIGHVLRAGRLPKPLARQATDWVAQRHRLDTPETDTPEMDTPEQGASKNDRDASTPAQD